MTCTPDKTVLADGKPPVNIKTEATQFYERGMIDMKKKMAIVLSLVLACSMSMTAFAAPSPSLNTGNTPAEQIVVDSSVTGTTAQRLHPLYDFLLLLRKLFQEQLRC